MQGQILDFSIQTSRGVITADDGARYAFMSTEWKEQSMPVKGMRVDFDVNADGDAVEVYQALPVKQGHSSVSKVKTAQSIPQSADESFFVIALNTLKYHYADFSGRASRREFWAVQLVNFGVSAALIVILAMLSIMAGMRESSAEGLINGVLGLYQLATFLPLLAIGVRRLHDVGKSGWWYLMAMIPLIGWVWLIVLWCQPSDDANQWG